MFSVESPLARKEGSHQMGNRQLESLVWKKDNSCECKSHNPSINHWKDLHEKDPAKHPETVGIVETINYRTANQFLPKLRMPHIHHQAMNRRVNPVWQMDNYCFN